jgi:hypothetical protein
MPYNLAYSNMVKPKTIKNIRKLALFNFFYISYGMAEDDVLDEYHLPFEDYKKLLLKMCILKKFREKVLREIIASNDGVWSYFSKYEKKYYEAVIWEKQNKFVNINNFLKYSNLKVLGDKILPLNLALASYYLKTNEKEKIKLSEKMLHSFHISYQLIDDLFDLEKDILKPDKSYLIVALNNSSPSHSFVLEELKGLLLKNNYALKNKIFAHIREFLLISEKIAKELEFQHFLNKINYSINSANTCCRD